MSSRHWSSSGVVILEAMYASLFMGVTLHALCYVVNTLCVYDGQPNPTPVTIFRVLLGELLNELEELGANRCRSLQDVPVGLIDRTHEVGRGFTVKLS